MDRRQLLGLVLAFSVVLYGAEELFSADRIEFSDYGIAFNFLPEEWVKAKAGKSNFFAMMKPNPNGAMVWIGASEFDAGKDSSLEVVAERWIEGMGSKYEWKNVTIVNEDWSSIGGQKAFYIQLTYKNAGRLITEKIYYVVANGRLL